MGSIGTSHYITGVLPSASKTIKCNPKPRNIAKTMLDEAGAYSGYRSLNLGL